MNNSSCKFYLLGSHFSGQIGRHKKVHFNTTTLFDLHVNVLIVLNMKVSGVDLWLADEKSRISQFIHSFIHSFTHLLIHWFVFRSFILSLIHSFVHSFVWACLLTHSLTHLLIHSFIHLFFCSVVLQFSCTYLHLYVNKPELAPVVFNSCCPYDMNILYFLFLQATCLSFFDCSW